MGTFSTIVSPRATSRCLTWVDDVGQVEDDLVALERHPPPPPPSAAEPGPVGPGFDPDPEVGEGIRCYELANLTVDQPVDRARQGRPASAGGGRSVMTPANTSFRTASMSSCCSMALVTVVAIDLHLGECTRVPTVSRYRCCHSACAGPRRDQRRSREQHGQHDTDDHPDRAPGAAAPRWAPRWSGGIFVGHSRPPRPDKLGVHTVPTCGFELVGPEPPNRNPCRPGPTLRSGLVHRRDRGAGRGSLFVVFFWQSSICPRSRPEPSMRRCRSERGGDVPQRQVRLHVAAGPLPPGQRDVLLSSGLYGTWLSRWLMMLSRPRFLSSVTATYQGAQAVSVAANMASRALE